MGINFYIGFSKKDIMREKGTAVLSEELQTFIWKNKNNFNIDLRDIFEIDPYGTTVILGQDLENLIEECETLARCEYITEYNSCDENYLEAINELIKLSLLCKIALNENLKVYALGD